MPPHTGVKVTKNNYLLVGADVNTADGVKIPLDSDTASGAGFGDTITDEDRAFAAEREPVAHFLTYGVASDITEKWFKIDDPDTEEADPALDRTTQEIFSKLSFKPRLTEACSFSRAFGKALLVCGFNDAKTVNDLKKPLTLGSELLQIHVYPAIKSGHKIKEWEISTKDDNPNSSRFGEPVIYKLDRGNGSYLYVHYSRICEVPNNVTETSSLDPIWDDMTCGRNIRWGASQWMYRTGSGFPVIGFPAGTTADQLETWATSGAFTDIMSRTGIFIAQNSTQENNGMTFDFKGPAGQSLDPTPFFRTNIEQIAVATGIPQAKLVGAQAGAVTGSEVNMQDYYKVISREQSALEPVIRWFIDKLTQSKQVTLIKATTDKNNNESYRNRLLKQVLRRVTGRDYRHRTTANYQILWNSAFELSETQEADIELKKVQANQGKLDYMTVDEIRAEQHLDPLPNGEGATLKSKSFGLFSEEKNQGGNEELAQADKYLVVDLNKKGAPKKDE